MSDFEKFQEELNGNEELRRQFLESPVQVMTARGFKLKENDKKKLNDAFKDLKAAGRADAKGKTEIGGSIDFKHVIGSKDN